MQNMLRLFIAVELSQEVHAQLGRLIEELKKHGCKTTRWVNPDNLHLTLKFLGDTPPATLSVLKQTIQAACKSIPTFQANARGTGVFPSLRQPRVLWAGLESGAALGNLVSALDSELANLGYKKESRPFSPHLTLARIASPENTPAFDLTLKSLFAAKEKEFGSIIVRRITLFQSTLSPGGSIYTPLERFQLLEKN